MRKKPPKKEGPRRLRFGEVLEFLMRRQRMSPRTLALQLGITPVDVYRLVHGLEPPPDKHGAELFAKALRVDPRLLIVAIGDQEHGPGKDTARQVSPNDHD